MKVFGVANHSPDFVLLYLQKRLKIPEEEIAIVSSTAKLPKRRTPYSYYIFLSSKAVRRNMASINRIEDCTAIVCAPPIELNGFKGLIPLDFSESDSPHMEGFLLDKIRPKRLKQKGDGVSYEPIDYAIVVQEKVESFTGILTSFMTFVYTMPSSTHQKPVKELACHWLVRGGDEPTLERELAQLTKSVHLTEKQKVRFMTLLTSESASAYKEALQEAKQYSIDSIEFRNVADKHSVSAYEMRYMLSVVKASS